MPNWQRWKNIMKAYPFEEKRLNKWKPPYIVQPKYDGVRCRAIPLPTGGYMLLSSEENVIWSVPHINLALENADLAGHELDGELYCHGMTFEQVVSITSRTKNIHLDHEKMQFHIFDYVSEEPQTQRVVKLAEADVWESPLIVSPYWLCNSLTEIMEVYNELITLGYEGIIVRHFLAPYVKKRSIYVMKWKPKQEDVYAIIGYEEEISIDGTPKGRLGSILCASGDGNTFSVGSGFTDSDRDGLWKIRETLSSFSLRAQYQHITSGRKVPRFPVFIEVIK